MVFTCDGSGLSHPTLIISEKIVMTLVLNIEGKGQIGKKGVFFKHYSTYKKGESRFQTAKAWLEAKLLRLKHQGYIGRFWVQAIRPNYMGKNAKWKGKEQKLGWECIKQGTI
jgi:hypothetical protein